MRPRMLSGQKGRVFWTLAAAHLINDSYVFVLPALLPLLIPSLGDLADGGRAGRRPVPGDVVADAAGAGAPGGPVPAALAGLAGAGGDGGRRRPGSGWRRTTGSLLLFLILGALGTSAFHPVATATISDIAGRPPGPDDVDLHHGRQPRAGGRAGRDAARAVNLGAGDQPAAGAALPADRRCRLPGGPGPAGRPAALRVVRHDPGEAPGHPGAAAQHRDPALVGERRAGDVPAAAAGRARPERGGRRDGAGGAAVLRRGRRAGRRASWRIGSAATR